jgi:acylphosphatase
VITKVFIIRGKVQGVGYRYHVKQTAIKLGITGVVKNLPDGSVKVTAQSEEGPLALFEAYLYKGSLHSSVESIEIKDIINPTIYNEFNIKL